MFAWKIAIAVHRKFSSPLNMTERARALLLFPE